MDNEFWHQKWAKNQIGFHLSEVHPSLRKYWNRLGGVSAHRVLVPLCGKSEDLAWLARFHESVVGVELSEIAVRAFFAERFYTPTVTVIEPRYSLYEFDEISIFCGDFYQAPLATYDLIYDRAALIALPQDMRVEYVAKLKHHLSEHGKILLVSLDYSQGCCEGPPFSVNESEIRQLFSEFQLTRLERNDETNRPPKATNAEFFAEEVWLIESL